MKIVFMKKNSIFLTWAVVLESCGKGMSLKSPSSSSLEECLRS